MGCRTHIARFVLLAMLPLLMLRGAVPGLTLFRCQHDHQVRLTTCCPDEGADSDEVDDTSPTVADALSTIDQSGCCEATFLKLSHDPYEAPTNGVQPVTPPLAFVVAHSPAPLIVVPVVPDGRNTFLNTGPPVRLRTLALLI